MGTNHFKYSNNIAKINLNNVSVYCDIFLFFIAYIIALINKYMIINKIILIGQRSGVLKSVRISHNALYILQWVYLVSNL